MKNLPTLYSERPKKLILAAPKPLLRGHRLPNTRNMRQLMISQPRELPSPQIKFIDAPGSVLAAVGRIFSG